MWCGPIDSLNVSFNHFRGQKEGYEQGLEIGRNQGIVEGQRLGWEKGAEIGSEVHVIPLHW